MQQAMMVLRLSAAGRPVRLGFRGLGGSIGRIVHRSLGAARHQFARAEA
jgi:hypothetical protein